MWGMETATRKANEMTFYVRRVHTDGRGGWVGPIRSERQARREQQAWESCGWVAWVEESSPAVRAAVRSWQRAMDVKHGRVKVAS